MSHTKLYLAAHKGLAGVAKGLPDELVIDWAQQFLDGDPQPDAWEKMFTDLRQRQHEVSRSPDEPIQLRAFARNSAGIAFGSVFCERAGFQIHYENKGLRWCTDGAASDSLQLDILHQQMSQNGRDLVLEVAVTQSAASVTLPVSDWLKHPSAINRERFRELLVALFNDEELRDLCSDLGVPYDDLPSQVRSGKARELLSYMERRSDIVKLIAACVKRRPNGDWYIAMPTPRKRVQIALGGAVRPITPEEGAAIARQVCGLVSSEGQTGGTVHLFAALPLGVALLIGWGLKADRKVQCYELDADSTYRPTCLLRT